MHSTILVEYILNYLAQTERAAADEDISLIPEVVKQASTRFENVTRRQFIERYKSNSTGKYYPSSSTKCERMSALRYIGADAELLPADVRMKFWYGDLLELGMVALIQLAFAGTPHEFGMNNEDVVVKFGRKYAGEHRGYIDGVINFNHEWHQEKYGTDLRAKGNIDRTELLLAEFKSMDTWSYGNFKKNGPEDMFGYMGQISKYQQATELKRFVYLAIDKQKGGLHEFVGKFDPKFTRLADTYYDLVMHAIENDTIPPVPKRYEWTASSRGMELSQPVCNYCSYKKACAEAAGMTLGMSETKGRYGPKPVWFAYKEGGGDEQTTIDDRGPDTSWL